MALVSLGADFGQGGSGLSDGRLAKALKELQSAVEVVVDGAAADTNIAVAGIKTTDTLRSVLMFDGGVPSSKLSATSITSAGNIQCADATTGKKLVVRYCVK